MSVLCLFYVSLLIIIKNIISFFILQIEVLNQHLFLTSKPVIYLVNLSEKDYIRKKNKWWELLTLIYISNISVCIAWAKGILGRWLEFYLSLHQVQNYFCSLQDKVFRAKALNVDMT